MCSFDVTSLESIILCCIGATVFQSIHSKFSLYSFSRHQRFPKSSEQYRIRGKLQFIGSQGSLYPYNESSDGISNNSEHLVSERKQQWGNLSDLAREQFYWENPGISFTSTWEKREGIPAGGRDAEGKVLPPPDTFLLMLVYPFQVDYLRLGDNFRQVDKWDNGDGICDCNWTSVRVNP
jgi:hypothetical protein